MNKIMIIPLAATFMLLGIHLGASPFSFQGNAAVTSSYVFRGIRQFKGAAYQGMMEGKLSRFTAGFWFSSVQFETDWSHETDFYSKYNFKISRLEGAAGVTVYAYDFYRYNSTADREFEFFGNFTYGMLSLGVYVVPGQPSTRNDPAPNNYWMELAIARSFKSLDWIFGINRGTYSSRYLENPQKDAVGTLTISASRKISDSIALSWFASIPIQTRLTNQYGSALTFSF